ncbi:MAG: helicase-related protein, partial [Verrucomicrobiota bacterium]
GVLLDEFHERGWELDLTATILRQNALTGRQSLPLVITSATLEADAVASNFEADRLEASGRTFPVSLSHTVEPSHPSSSWLDQRVVDGVETTLSRGLDGDILVFLPGMGEIASCEKALAPLTQRQDLELVRVHGTLPTDRIAKALATKTHHRRVFLATNVAETSLTIPGVTTVIDSGLARMRTHRAGRSSLVLTSISHAAMEQRRGRAGRVAPGHCVRLWSAQFQPPASTTPEISRIELDDLVLTAAACGLQGAPFDEAPWPTPPPAFALANARQRLRDLGALDDLHEITPFGRQLLALPVSAHEARLLVDPPSHLSATLCDLVALLQARGDLLLPAHQLPPQHREDILDSRASLLQGITDEATANLHLLRHGHGREHGLHASALQDARRIATQLRSLLGCDVIDPTRDPTARASRTALATFLLQRWPEAAFVLRQRVLTKAKKGTEKRNSSKGDPWGNGDVELTVRSYPLWENETSSGPWPVAGLLLSQEWISGSSSSVLGIGGLLLPCTYEQLADLGFGELQPSEIHLSKAKSHHPRISATLERTLAGVTLRTEQAPLTGAELRTAAAELISQQRLLTDAGRLAASDVHLAHILLHWPKSSPDAPPQRPQPASLPDSLETLLESRLTSLGVEACEDFQLLSPEDFRLDLEGLFGLFPNQIEDLRAEFPPTWTFEGALFRCHVEAAKRLVTLLPADSRSGKAPPPEAWALPSFHGFRVQYQKASRILKLRG